MQYRRLKLRYWGSIKRRRLELWPGSSFGVSSPEISIISDHGPVPRKTTAKKQTGNSEDLT